MGRRTSRSRAACGARTCRRRDRERPRSAGRRVHGRARQPEPRDSWRRRRARCLRSTRADVVAIHRRRTENRHCGGVTDVDLGQQGLGGTAVGDVAVHDTAVHARDHKRAIAREQQLAVVGVGGFAGAVGEGDRTDDRRRIAADVGCPKPVAGDREHRRATRLDDVGLVDPFLLHVRGRVGGARSRGHALGRAADRAILDGDRHLSRGPCAQPSSVAAQVGAEAIA